MQPAPSMCSGGAPDNNPGQEQDHRACVGPADPNKLAEVDAALRNYLML